MVSHATRAARKMRHFLLKKFGEKCEVCGSREDLEFAHISPTKLNGEGRGQWHRAMDAYNNMDKYALLCKKCHTKFDNGHREEHLKIILSHR